LGLCPPLGASADAAAAEEPQAPPPPAAAGGTLAAIMAADRAARDAAARRQQAAGPWLLEGIVVRVCAPELAARGFHRAKGIVRALLHDGFVAELELAAARDGDAHADLLRVDQAQLQTVLPAVGGAVRVLAGAGRGATATLLGVDEARFAARVRIRTPGDLFGAELALPYEEVSKLA
jgi:DNA/RNA-binding protein KIN17